ncbi:PstS family phosphate ABC transporter substrate-binding protein [Serpentinicella sp. ANB-PHB4]|uniref:PstS family phosphate ABC transporter substrate-binding protein n=1 Tax=Serpentinicella sp. ANB-PHB4 TaxID=3074076 RepID=UPI002865C0B2|nr:PstS family phosphate ABC transporter substrate-binding protein [Serpentinicella sp. ANB-PHB4]MDR5658839.1 PstS family phosphate ABC transporter substrate-binding protein [Serpentinicella sp. ANB-PHB4]
MKKLVLFLVVALTASVMLIGCGGENTPTDQGTEANGSETNTDSGVDFSKLVQARGSDTMVNLGGRWAEEFMDEYPEAQMAVTGGGSGTGIAAMINGTIDIALSSRAIRDKEIDDASANGVEVVEFVTGRDGIAVVVNNDNPVAELTRADIKAIFTGEKTNWKDFGGNDAEITLYSRESNSGTYAFFKEFVLDDEEYATHSNLMPSTQAIVEGVQQDVNGIGYVGLAYLSDQVQGVSVSMDENSEAVYPSLETIQAGDYPVARPLFLYTDGQPTGVVELFMDFVMGTQGQHIVEDIGFIPVK